MPLQARHSPGERLGGNRQGLSLSDNNCVNTAGKPNAVNRTAIGGDDKISVRYDFEHREWVPIEPPAPRRCFGEGVFERLAERKRRRGIS